jgi:hypothetical protein
MGAYTDLLKWLLVLAEIVRDLAVKEEGLSDEEFSKMRAEIEAKRDATVDSIIKLLREKLAP